MMCPCPPSASGWNDCGSSRLPLDYPRPQTSWTRLVPIVVDGCALAEVVLRSQRAAGIEALFGDEALVAPDLVGAEVLSVVRGMLMRRLIDQKHADRAVENLAAAPVRRMTTEFLTRDMWTIRSNVTPYDAAYVVLARALAAPLITLDARLTRAPGLGVRLLLPE